jgi:hypothetical protein
MKSPLLKKILPHIIAIVIFLIVSILFCKPILDGNVLNQHDTIGWKGMAQNAFEYKERTGHYPLWNPNLFSGMPNYQVAMEGKSILPDTVKIFSLGMPKPINFFFLACICFYILCITLRTRPVVGMLAGLAYAFSTYNPVVINAGHDTQMLATAFLPLLIAGLICTYEKKYWLGLALTTYATYQQIGVNHLQISYYTFLIALAITICYLYTWIRAKDWKHIGIAAGITIFSALVGLAGNALILKTTSEYTKYTMRGGKDISIEGDTVKSAATKGLDTSYAFIYSLGKAETFTLMMPNAFGGSSAKTLGENSKVVAKLSARGIQESNAQQVAGSLPKYWGALPYTAGPAYLGVFIFILGLLGFVFVRSPLRWGLLAATIFGILISWGKNFAGFNTFLFEHLPMYNKFRAPSMAQVIPQFTMAVSAALAIQQILFNNNAGEWIKNNFRKILYTVGGLFGLLIILYLVMDYSSPIDGQIAASISAQAQSEDIGRAVISGMKADRHSMFFGQLIRALAFALILLGTFYALVKNWIRPMIAAIILLVIGTVELTMVSRDYLNDESYIPADDFTSTNFAPTAIDQVIQKDRDSNFRVFNMAADTYNESKTSYFHKSIGGYHPAKLRIYQDVIEKYLSNRPDPRILNMLNARYLIVPDPQSGQPQLIPNVDAYGPCWLVKNVQVVDNRVEAFKAIGKLNLEDTAVVDKSFASLVVQPQPDSSSTIRMTKFDNDAIDYEANCNGPQFAVFSEIYYPKGWNAYLDGKKVDYCNVNYILRGLSIPAGKHSIRFVFEPESVKKGRSLMFIASIIVLIVFLGGLYMHFRKELPLGNKDKTPARSDG